MGVRLWVEWSWEVVRCRIEGASGWAGKPLGSGIGTGSVQAPGRCVAGLVQPGLVIGSGRPEQPLARASPVLRHGMNKGEEDSTGTLYLGSMVASSTTTSVPPPKVVHAVHGLHGVSCGDRAARCAACARSRVDRQGEMQTPRGFHAETARDRPWMLAFAHPMQAAVQRPAHRAGAQSLGKVPGRSALQGANRSRGQPSPRARRSQSKPAPGSPLRSGAMCSWPTTSRSG